MERYWLSVSHLYKHEQCRQLFTDEYWNKTCVRNDKPEKLFFPGFEHGRQEENLLSMTIWNTSRTL